VQVLALRDQARTHRRHQVLSANQPADAADVGVEDDEVGSVATAPEDPL